jgi:hypothetical protein
MGDTEKEERIEYLRTVTKEDILRLLGSTPEEGRVYLSKSPDHYFTVKDVRFDENKQQLLVSLKFPRKDAKQWKKIKKIIAESKKEVE